MKYFTYILYSNKLGQYYKGHSCDPYRRLIEHNTGQNSYSKKGAPWSLIWYTQMKTKSDAYRLEMKLKNLSQSRTESFIRKYKEGIVGPDDPD